MAAIPPLQPEQIVNFLYTIYYFLRDAIIFILQTTVFKEYPDYAFTYGDAITFLVSITAVYLILEFITAAKKFIKVILILGWFLLFVTIAISLAG
ncbi:MAG TPA: hypothetical protein ENF47_04085 [Thermoprotei archaeon]|nr:hypothetical protein [Thermoprotei archaeon]